MVKSGLMCKVNCMTFYQNLFSMWCSVERLFGGLCLGGMQDYNYLKGNCFEVTLELSCCKYPPVSQLYIEWANNREALLLYMQKVRWFECFVSIIESHEWCALFFILISFKAHIGVKGFVMTSSGLGLPDATISVSGTDHNITTWTFGDYYRLLLPGIYDITASSPGWLNMTSLTMSLFKTKRF